MITVSDDPVDVEMALGSGALSCPRCSARLAPWGSARPRLIRHGIEEPRVVRAYRPRRARCSGCRVTHVLLDVRLASRRADAAEVIAASVERKVALGWGHRRIGAWVGRPETTVRGWLRAFARSASRIAERFTLWVVRDAPDAVGLWPRPSGSLLAAALVGAACLRGSARAAIRCDRQRGVGAGGNRCHGRGMIDQPVGGGGPTRTGPSAGGTGRVRVAGSACHIR